MSNRKFRTLFIIVCINSILSCNQQTQNKEYLLTINNTKTPDKLYQQLENSFDSLQNDTIHLFIDEYNITEKQILDSVFQNVFKWRAYRNEEEIYYPLFKINLGQNYIGFVLKTDITSSELQGKAQLLRIYNKSKQQFLPDYTELAILVGEAGEQKGMESRLLDVNKDGLPDIIQQSYETYRDPGEPVNKRTASKTDLKLFLFNKEG